MSPVLSIFTLFNPFSLGLKGGICFEKEGFFRPSFLIEERRIFLNQPISPINLNKDSMHIFTKSNSFCLDFRFVNYNNYISIEFYYKRLFQIFDIYNGLEYMKLSKVKDGFEISFNMGKNIKKCFIGIGIEFSRILNRNGFKIESGVLI